MCLCGINVGYNVLDWAEPCVCVTVMLVIMNCKSISDAGVNALIHTDTRCVSLLFVIISANK